MADTCDPGTLVEAAKCFDCLTPPQKEAVKTYLLAVVAGYTASDLQTIMQNAACFACMTTDQHKAADNWLMCQILKT